MIPSEAKNPTNNPCKWVGVQTIVANSCPLTTMVSGYSTAIVSFSMEADSPSKRTVSHPLIIVLSIELSTPFFSGKCIVPLIQVFR